MNKTQVLIDEKIDELLCILDKDAERLRVSLLRLDELRALLVKRDEKALARLLENIRMEIDGHKDLEDRRQLIRQELAIILKCDFSQVTLTRLASEVDGEKSERITSKKAELQSLATRLKEEHLRTMMLLSDCSRINSVLLNGILNFTRTGTVTYSNNGKAKRHSETAFVNMQF